MTDPLAVIRSLGGTACLAELRNAGISERQVATARLRGRIERVRIGHYVDPAISPRAKQALRVGGRLTCASASAEFGAKTLADRSLHVSVNRHDSSFRRPEHPTSPLHVHTAEVTIHWEGTRVGLSRLAVPLAHALGQSVGCLSVEGAVSLIDSALYNLPQVVSLAEISHGLSHHDRSILAAVDARAESVTESIFRLRASAEGLRFQIQAPLPGGRFADFLFGDRLVVEVYGAEFHSGPKAFADDRNRDAWLSAAGYYVLRFSYDQVVNRWHEVASVLALVIRRGDHLASRRP